MDTTAVVALVVAVLSSVVTVIGLWWERRGRDDAIVATAPTVSRASDSAAASSCHAPSSTNGPRSVSTRIGPPDLLQSERGAAEDDGADRRALRPLSLRSTEFGHRRRWVALRGRAPVARVRDSTVMNHCTITLIGKPERMSGFVDAYRARIVISDDGASRESWLAAFGEDFLKADRLERELDEATWEQYAERAARHIAPIYDDLNEIPDELRLGVLLRVG